MHITGRRNDGYHLLQTAFQLLDYGDELTFALREDNEICLLNQFEGVSQQNNLIWRAAAELRKLARANGQEVCGVDISIEKKIPMGGGLGGGSSNAATTLLALNCLWECNLKRSELAGIGLSLGADVPVFVHGCSAWAEGVGENLQPLELPERWYVVAYPGVHVSTAELFSNSELTRDCTPITIAGFRRGESVFNVFQSIVCAQQPAVKEALRRLKNLASEYCVNAENDVSDPLISGPLMTGTGSCVFLPCEDKQQAQNVQRGLTDGTSACERMSVFIARGVNQSPLNKALTAFRNQHYPDGA